MLNGVYTPELSDSIGKRQQFFHWKTPGTGSEIANSLTVEGNFRVPATRRATNKMADATTCGRNLSIKYPTIADFRNAIPLIRIRSYTILYDETIASYSYGEKLTVELRRRLTKCLRSSTFYRKPPGGSRGHQVHTECICTWLSIGFY